ncbi:MAG: aldo/keto reductase [Chloroflexi bacterium]|nr:aldo/keto reductase [Chloroflexota bacterium]
MRKRRLGGTDVHLTTVGLGTWAIGGSGWSGGWGMQNDEESIAAIQRAIDLGVNWIDTAPAYGLGHSEEVVGQAIKGRRDQVLVATKCGNVWNKGDNKLIKRLTADSIRQEIEDSLRRLDIDVIDLYQIHWPIPDEDIEEAWAEIGRAVEQGKVRYAGVCNFSVEQLDRIRPIHPVASLQPPYSMLRRDVEEDILPYCAQRGIGVVCYSPMQAGLLTGKFTREWAAALKADDWRSRSRDFQDPELSANLALVDGLRPIAEARGCSLAQLAIAWVLRRPEVTSAIAGARRPSQIEETAGAMDVVLSDDEIAGIDALLEVRSHTSI